MDKLQREIERVAYELYEKRGSIPGYHLDDWLEAERIVMARHAKTKEGEGKTVKAVKRKTTVRKPKEGETRPARKASPKKTTAKKTL